MVNSDNLFKFLKESFLKKSSRWIICLIYVWIGCWFYWDCCCWGLSGIWSPNSYQWIVTMSAASKAGLILVNVNPNYKVHELEYCLNKVQMKAIIAAEGSGNLKYYEHFLELFPELATKKDRKIKSKRFAVPWIACPIQCTIYPMICWLFIFLWWFMHRLIIGLIDWLIDFDSFIYISNNRPVGRFIYLFWFTCSIFRIIYFLERSIDWLMAFDLCVRIEWFIDFFGHFVILLLKHWLIDWLIDWCSE